MGQSTLMARSMLMALLLLPSLLAAWNFTAAQDKDGQRRYAIRCYQVSCRIAGRSEWIWKLEELADFNRDSIQFYFSKCRHDLEAARASRP